jgi:GNAT superfamily N-acetyltransferase
MSETWSIGYLADEPALIPILASWFVEAWAPYYGADGPGDATADLAACNRRDRLPVCLVAFDADRKPIGTVALKESSVASHDHLAPWLAALVVPPAMRDQGVGTFLVAALEQEARRLGFSSLYAGVSPESSILSRRGWREIDRAGSLRGEIAIVCRSLG